MKFTQTHDWIDIEGEKATLGITQYAQRELGEVVYVELPRLHSIVYSGDAVVVLESTKAAIDIYAPLSGEILEVNTALKEEPQKINQSPESGGWLYKIRLHQPSEADPFMDHSAYLAYTENR